MNPPDFRQQLADKAARVHTEAPSTTKWNGVRNLIAEQVGLGPDDVYVTTISKPENVSVRFFQSKRVFRASVLVAMHTDAPENIPGTTKALLEIAAERDASALVATRDGDDWSIVAILKRSGDKLLEPLAKACPTAVVLPV
ncbi:MAG TPA: hypothetical protein VF081_10365 [Solirubrobacterales bacterium]